MDREKVIKGLEVCTKPGTRGCFYDIKECPYNENGCRMALMRDALDLLKEQEEKIKTLHIAQNVIADYLQQPEIVRCNQCKHVETCCRRRTNDPNWFCADGERAENAR